MQTDMKKDKKNKEERGDAFVKEKSMELITLAASNFYQERKDDFESWNIYHGVVKSNKYDYLTKVDGLTFPAKMRHIGVEVVRSKLNLLESRQARRTFRFKCSSIDERSLKAKVTARMESSVKAIKEMYEERTAMVQMQLNQINERMRELQETLQIQPDNPEAQAQLEELKANMPMIQLEMERMMRHLNSIQLDGNEMKQKADYFLMHSEQEIVQQMATASLKSAITQNDLNEHWNVGLREKFVTGKPTYYVYYNPRIKDVVFKQTDSVYVSYDKGGNNKWIQDGDSCGLEEFMTPEQIRTEFELTEEEDRLLETYVGGNYSTIKNYQGNSAVFDPGQDYDKTRYNGVSVHRLWFLAPREVYYKTSPNKHRKGENFYHLTTKDAEIKSTERKKRIIIYDMYASVVIGDTICINLGKQEQVFRPRDTPGRPMLPLVGRTFNAVSESPYSLIHRVKELIELYDIINYKKELLICLAGVRGMIMDKSQKPDDMTTKRWMYYRKMGTMWIETMKKGRKNPASYNQFQTFDDTLSQSIQFYDASLGVIDQVMGRIMGITEPALGQFVKDDAVGNVKMSNEQSSLITQILYKENDDVYKKAMDLFLNLKARYVWDKEKVINYMNKDLEEVLIHIQPGTINKSDFRLYCNNNIKEDDRLEDLRNIAIQSWSRGSIPVESVATLINVDDLKEMENSLIKFSRQAEEIQQANASANEEQRAANEERLIQTQHQMGMQLEEFKMQAEGAKMELDNRKQQFEEAKFEWEAQFKEKELAITAEQKAFDTATENEIESAYLEEEGRSNRTQEVIQFHQMRLNALISKLGIDAGEAQSQRKATVDMDKNKNMRNKVNIKD